MDNVILVRYGEIHLKGLNRPYFERMLITNIKKSLKGIECKIHRDHGRIFINGISDDNIAKAIDKLSHVFGVYSISPAITTEKDFDAIAAKSVELIKMRIANSGDRTFKVFAKRADKAFPMDSMAICRELGGVILDNIESVSVDVHNPEIELNVEIRDVTYIYTDTIPCAGGMPVGTSGRCALLLSGGIDSPVAGYMLSRRGVELSAVHFYSYPYTSVRARDKVIELARLMSEYTGEIRLHLVPFTDIQMQIYDKCPSKETTILMRRLMMKIAEVIAINDSAKALITGESLAQVASQTLESLCVTDDAVSMPVFRPLIGFDKEDIVRIARKINTFETSILPYEDCCTVFVPQHPVTHPDVQGLRKSESLLNDSIGELIQKAIEQTEIMLINPN